MVSLLKLAYLTPEELAAARAVNESHILGAIAFGAEPPVRIAPDVPYAWIDMPVLGANTVFETWLSAAPVIREGADGCITARNEELLFGCIQIEHPGSLDDATYAAYARLFDFIDSRGYAHLLRAWNYFPEINSDAEGLERYQRFCRGRHEAFSAKGRIIGQDTPAASALGTRSGPLTVYFLAGKTRGERVENPRQTSAYHYPAQYGPRSPTFSRGMLLQQPRGAVLFISGTAGIVGHETQHPGSATHQARETIENIRAVMSQGRIGAFHSAAGRFAFKVYARHADDVPVVQRCLRDAFGAVPDVLYLQADICRADLLLEIEGVYFDETGARP